MLNLLELSYISLITQHNILLFGIKYHNNTGKNTGGGNKGGGDGDGDGSISCCLLYTSRCV